MRPGRATRLRESWRQHLITSQSGGISRADPRDFSIVLGGPLFQLLRRAHMTGNALEMVRRRIVVIAMLAWLPLLVLTVIGGTALGGDVAVPFVKDLEVHARFLVAMPLLIAAELVVHLRLRPVANEFVLRGLVDAATVDRFHAAVRAAMRLRNSVVAEVLMLVFIYSVGIPVVWRQLGALDVATWYATPADGLRFTAAGMWYAYVSVPVFQFLLLRWYFRLVVWMRFLWSVSRIPLQLTAMHADRMAGLGFLSGTVFAFIPLAMAHGALVAGTIANRIFYAGSTLQDSAVEIAIVVAALIVLVVVPLMVFGPQIADAKRNTARAYGRLAQRYAFEFESKWIPGSVPARASALGSGDIQSLADLANSVAAINDTSLIPITRQNVIVLALATLVPIAPLLLTVIPARELATQLLKLLV
jgi:hypothetical protein